MSECMYYTLVLVLSLDHLVVEDGRQSLFHASPGPIPIPEPGLSSGANLSLSSSTDITYMLI